jgi:hypothetical protein
MSQAERADEAWYSGWVVHACILAILLVSAAAVGIDSHLHEPSQLPPDRPVPVVPVRLSGTTLERVRVVPASSPTTGQPPAAGK